MNESDQTSGADGSGQGDLGAAQTVTQLGLFAAVSSLGYVFWVVGGMEMIERLAFYGVKAVATLYATDPAKDGGLGVTMTEFGIILSTWAAVQSFIPVFTGGLSDRYGYKETIFISTLVKIVGYLVMAFFPTFSGFFVGAMILAVGTAVFKPGIQGTLVKTTSPENSSIAWGIFYQTVNIGGFLGPILAGALRKLAWQHVFFACAAIISLNFLLLLIYKETGKEERLARNAKAKRAAQDAKARRLVAGASITQRPPAGLEREIGRASTLEEPIQGNLVADSIRELVRPHVWLYLLVFSGFWFMFNSIFDVLPLHIRDWVDSTDIVTALFGSAGGNDSVLNGWLLVLSPDGHSIAPEGMLNVNAGLIMITCFFFAFISGKMRATTSMVVGTLFASVSLYLTGLATAGWASVFALCVFSVGEMLSSPKFSEFMGAIAPADKKAMYLGFSQIPLGIGWTLEGMLGPVLYDKYASKELFSRELLVERGLLTSEETSAVPNGEAFERLVELSGETPKAITDILYQSHDVAMVWNIMAAVGLISAVGIFAYGKWMFRLHKNS